MSSPVLQGIFNQPPELAIKYLQSKGYKVSWDWYEMLGKAHNRAFTVAKATSQDVLDDIQKEMEKALREGMTFEQFKRNLKPRLVEKGWWGRVENINQSTGEITKPMLGSVSRLRTIFSTNMATSFAAGRYERIQDNKIDRPYLQYLSINDGRVRPEHRELHGKLYHVDDPIWDIIFPPNGFGCRCRVRSLSQADVDRLGLSVESSQGFQTNKVKINRDGDTVDVQSVKIVGRSGKAFWFRPDPGWDYAPSFDEGV